MSIFGSMPINFQSPSLPDLSKLKINTAPTPKKAITKPKSEVTATQGKRKSVPGYLGTKYEPRELRGAEKTLFDIQMQGYNKSYQEKFPEVTREQYAESVKRTIIAPQYQRERTYVQSMLKQLEAGSDPRAAAKMSSTEMRADILKEQLEQQAQMKAVAKASKSQFGAKAMAAGMTGAGSLVSTSGISSGAAPISTGSSLIRSDIVRAATKPKVSAIDARVVEKATEAQKVAQERIESEIKTQQTLAPIRERRRRRAEQEASLLRRQTGRRALLSSPAGGAGFFTGYFK